MRELTDEEDVYWVRTHRLSGKITAALVEKHFSKAELENELNDMRKFGPVRRILASRVVIGDALKASA
jgi:hypothetical protein